MADETPLPVGTQEVVDTLIQGIQLKDPRLYQILQRLNAQLGAITNVIQPLIRVSGRTQRPGGSVFPVISFEAESTGLSIRFTWEENVPEIFTYELRREAEGFINDIWIEFGTPDTEVLWKSSIDHSIVVWKSLESIDNWDLALFQFRTAGLSGEVDPLPYGLYIFLLKTVNQNGVYSDDLARLSFLVPLIAGVTISKSVIDNNVLLFWEPPDSLFDIDRYEIFKDGELKGATTSTFTSFFEVVAGTYTYSIVTVDVAENRSIETFITAEVNTPPDYALQDTRVSDLSGARVNVLLLGGPKLMASWAPQTFEDHFLSRSWLTPRNQMDAGYPIYIQPAAINGSYEEIIDYGVEFNNIIVTVTWNLIVLSFGDNVSILVKMATSEDNITYTTFSNGASQFFSSFRYLKLRLEFTGDNDRALVELYNLTTNLNVKREMDGGDIDALATDVTGTEVFFTKAFKDIESLTVSVKSTTVPYIAIYDFADVPNPIHFFVYAYDRLGARVSKTVSWKARGIV